jgi:hypothetical protein
MAGDGNYPLDDPSSEQSEFHIVVVIASDIENLRDYHGKKAFWVENTLMIAASSMSEADKLIQKEVGDRKANSVVINMHARVDNSGQFPAHELITSYDAEGIGEVGIDWDDIRRYRNLNRKPKRGEEVKALETRSFINIMNRTKDGGTVIIGGCKAARDSKLTRNIFLAGGSKFNLFVNYDISTISFEFNKSTKEPIKVSLTTQRENLKRGWVHYKDDGTVHNLKNENSDGNISFDSKYGLTIKP